MISQMPPMLIIDLAKGYGGAEVRVFDTAQALHDRHACTVAALVGSPLHQRLKAAGLATLPVPFSRSDPRLLFFLWQAMRQQNYGVVDAHNVQSQFWGHLAAALAGVKSRLSTVHSAYQLEHEGSKKGRWYERVLWLNARLGVKFIAVSEAVLDYLQSIDIPPEQVTLIHNSIQLPRDVAPNRNLPLLKTLGWGPDTYIVVVVARLEPVKGHQYLIEAVSRIATAQPRLRCLFVGEGRTRPALENQIKAAGLQRQIHLTGFRSDIPDLLKAANAFCLPSLSEGLPYAVLEACSYRSPLLVTEVGGMAQLLSHKQTAYLVPPSNPEALAQGLNWLMNNPAEAETMAQTAYLWLKQNFSLEEMMAKILTAYAN